MYNELIELLYLKGLSEDALVEYIKYGSYSAFKLACYNGHLEVVKFLLKQGFVKEQMESSGCSALMSACYSGQLKVVKFLLEQGFAKEQIETLRKYEFHYYKIKYKDLVEKGIVRNNRLI